MSHLPMRKRRAERRRAGLPAILILTAMAAALALSSIPAHADEPAKPFCDTEAAGNWAKCQAGSAPPFNDPVFSGNDPYSDWWIWAIEAPAAWTRGVGDPNVLVAIVDDGAKLDHEDLEGRIAHQGSWHNLDGTFVEETFFTDTYFDHGTPIAAIIGGAADNGVGSAGLCPGCSIMPMQFRYSGDLTPTTGSLLWGLIYSVMADPRPRIINLSSGGGDYEEELVDQFHDPETRLSATRTFLLERGEYLENYYTNSGDWDLFNISFHEILTVTPNENVLVIVAAGNQAMPGDLFSICYHPATLCVGNVAAREDGTIAPSPGSNYGLSVQVSAPGTFIWAADAGEAGYDWHIGTSFSAPVVAGLAGLLASAHPELTARDLRQIIVASAVPLRAESNGVVTFYEGGGDVADEVDAWRQAFLRLLGKDETLLLDGWELMTLVDKIPYEMNGVWQRAQRQTGEASVDGVVCARTGIETVEEFWPVIDSDACAKAVGPLINARRALELAAAGGWRDRFVSFSDADFAAAAALDPAELAALARSIYATRSN